MLPRLLILIAALALAHAPAFADGPAPADDSAHGQQIPKEVSDKIKRIGDEMREYEKVGRSPEEQALVQKVRDRCADDFKAEGPESARYLDCVDQGMKALSQPAAEKRAPAATAAAAN